MTSLDRAPISSWIRSQTLSEGEVMATEFLGYRYDLEDRESIQRDAAPYSELLKSSEWKEQELFSWWHVRNQGPKGACRGHSLAANARLCYRMRAGSIDLDQDGIENEANLQDDFSPDWCYYRCQAASGIRGDNGATIEGGKAGWIGRRNRTRNRSSLPKHVRAKSGKRSTITSQGASVQVWPLFST